MKKILSFFISLQLFTQLFAEPVSRVDAMNTARAFLSQKGKALLQTSQPYCSPRQGSGILDEKAYYYIFNVGGEQGYVIVSGDDRTEQVLGYVDNGHFEADNLPVNMQGMLQYYSDAIQHLDDNNIQLPSKLNSPRKVGVTRRSVPILMASRWNQGYPFNKHCPIYYNADGSTGQAVTGCTATAIAQVINFYKHPDKTKAQIPAHSCTYTLNDGTQKTVTNKAVPRGTVIDWENMCEVYTGNETEAQTDAVGHLMLYVGMCVKMGYGPSSGAVHGSNVPELLNKYFDFDDAAYCASRYDYSAQEWEDLLYSELSTGHPLSYQGFSTGGGHAFVIDGYDGEGLYHVNWGWGGSSDGWFVISILNPGDNSGIGASGSSDGYSMQNNAIIGVRLPDSHKTESRTCASITDVKINGTKIEANFINWTGTTNSFSDAIVESLEDGTIKTVSNVQTQTNLNANYYHRFSFDMNGRLSDGIHKLSPASKLYSNKIYRPLYDLTRNYIEAKVEGGKMTLRFVQPEPIMEVSNIEYPGTRIAGKEQEVRVTFKNTGDEFFGHVKMLYSQSTDFTKAEKAESAVLVNSGDSTTVSYFMKPTATGDWNIWIQTDDLSNVPNGIIGHSVMKAITESEAVLPKLSVSSMTISNVSSNVVYGNFLEGKISIKNNSDKPFAGRIKLQSWSQNSGENTAWSSKSTSVYIEVQPLKFATAEFILEELRTDCKYWISVNDVTSGTQLTNGGVWDHGWQMNPGIVGWKSDGTKAVVSSSTTSTTSSWCGVYIEGVKTSKQRPNKNPNTIYAYASGITPSTSLNGFNVVTGSVAEEINLVSDTAYVVPVQFTATRATFRYDCKAEGVNRWDVVTLPFKPDSMIVDGITYPLNEEGTPFCLYEFYKEDDNGMPVFEPAKELYGNAPYLIAYNQDLAGKSIQFVADGALFIREGDDKKVVSGKNFRLYGSSYAPKKKNVYMLNDAGSAFEWISTSTAIRPIGAYFVTLLPESVRPTAIPLCQVPVLTSIECVPAILARPTEGIVFTLDGKCLPEGTVLQRGIYVVNGKKMLVK